MPRADPEERRKYSREYYLRNREARLKYEAEKYRRENPDGPRINDTCKRGHSLVDAPIRKDNGQRLCLPCQKANSREYYERNRDKVKAASSKWQKDNLPGIRAKRYGLTAEQVEAMRAEQEGRCATCERPAKVIDHCHASGRVRSMLCSYCNTALGMASDDPDRLRALATYLEKHMSQPRFEVPKP